MMLRLIPISLKDANAFADSRHHRHRPVMEHKFSIGCGVKVRFAGVVIGGRPAEDLYPAQMELRYEKLL